MVGTPKKRTSLMTQKEIVDWYLNADADLLLSTIDKWAAFGHVSRAADAIRGYNAPEPIHDVLISPDKQGSITMFRCGYTYSFSYDATNNVAVFERSAPNRDLNLSATLILEHYCGAPAWSEADYVIASVIAMEMFMSAFGDFSGILGAATYIAATAEKSRPIPGTDLDADG